MGFGLADILTTVQQGVVAINNLGIQLTVASAAWTPYTPAVSASAGAITTFDSTGRYKKIGKTVFIEISITITIPGSGSGVLLVAAPIKAASAYIICGREIAVNGSALTGTINGSSVIGVLTYNNLTVISSGWVNILSGIYESV